MNREVKDRINGCIAVEHAVASIYASFVRMFPAEKGFWEKLYNEEIEHSAFLVNTLDLYSDSSLPTGLNPPALPYVVKALEFANNINFRIRVSPVSLKDALDMSLKLEETMVEAFINDLVNGVMSSGIIPSERDFRKLLAFEKEHVSRIRDMMFRKGFLKPS
ncbi:MAG: hypothetical protein HY809_07135 [Nitrospirae bacterium]|nr:hypothetical protein [Nitrospirota bacterium]